MTRPLLNYVQLLKSKPILAVVIFLFIRLLWIARQEAICKYLNALTKISTERIELLIEGTLILIASTVILILISRQVLANLKSSNQYKMLFDSNPTPMWIINKQTLKFLQVNDTAISIYGYSAEEFKNMTILDITATEDKERRRKNLVGMPYENSLPCSYEHVKKNGDVFMGKVSAHLIRFEDEECIMGMAEDITVQLLQEKALRLLHHAEKEYQEDLETNIKQLKATLQEKQRLAEVVERIHNMVIITNPEGIISWVNKAFIDTTGYSFREAVGQTTCLMHGPKTDPILLDEMLGSIKKKDYSVFERIHYAKNGIGYWVEITMSAIYNDLKEVVRYIYVQNIITGRKLRDFQIVEQNTVLKKLAWTNSHTVRKPIASILSLVQIGEDAKSLHEIQEIHGFIGVCSKELDAITREVGLEINNRNLDGYTEV
jgi:PAS domain S-box-containing protein